MTEAGKLRIYKAFAPFTASSMVCDHIFFVYNPVHWIFATAIITEKKLKNVVIFGPKYLRDNFQATQQLAPSVQLKYQVIGELTSNRSALQKLISYLYILFVIPFGSKPTLWTANINSKLNDIFLAVLQISSVSVIDEGAIELVEARGHLHKLQKLIKKGLHIDLWLYHAAKFPIEKYQHLSIYSLYDISQSYFSSTALLSALKTNLAINEKSVLFLTSPVTENGNAAYKGQEVEIITKVISKNRHRHFFLKMHYREDNKKYENLASIYDNITVIDNQKHRNLPIQMLLGTVGTVCGFHTSVLFHAADDPSKRVVSLSGLVGSAHSKIALATLPDSVQKPTCLETVKF